MNHGLKPHHLQEILHIIQQSCPNIERVGLFGSRATGLYKRTSDVDLVLYGEMNEREQNHLYTRFLESSVPYKVDVISYDQIAYPPLKRHVDSAVKILFAKEQLRPPSREHRG